MNMCLISHTKHYVGILYALFHLSLPDSLKISVVNPFSFVGTEAWEHYLCLHGTQGHRASKMWSQDLNPLDYKILSTITQTDKELTINIILIYLLKNL